MWGEELKIAVVDGQGGGLGKALISRLSEELKDCEVIALGTNSNATLGMLKAGASVGATGENAIRVTCQGVDIIAGPMAIIAADSMMGEITQVMADAVAKSSAVKVLLPINRCNMVIAGVQDIKLNELIEDAVLQIKKLIGQKGVI